MISEVEEIREHNKSVARPPAGFRVRGKSRYISSIFFQKIVSHFGEAGGEVQAATERTDLLSFERKR